MILSPLQSTVLALAPPSEFHPPTASFFHADTEREIDSVVASLAKILGVSPSDVENTIDREHIPAVSLRPLLHELHYLLQNLILDKDQLSNLREQPLPRVIKLLMALAWKCEHSAPWRIDVETPLPEWDHVPLKDLLAAHPSPDPHTAAMLDACVTLVPFSAANFFTHRLFDHVPEDVRETIRATASKVPKANAAWMTETLALIFLNPLFSRDAAPLVSQHANIPGVMRLLTKIKEISPDRMHDFFDNVGALHELAHLEQSFLARGYKIAEIGPKVVFRGKEYTEVDVLAVRDGRMFLGEIKAIDLSYFYRMYGEHQIVSDPGEQAQFLEMLINRFPFRERKADRLDFQKPARELVREAWVMGNIERKIEIMIECRKKGLLAPLARTSGVDGLGGVVFSIDTRGDTLLEKRIVETARELSQKYGLPIEVDFISKPALAIMPGNLEFKGEHPRRAHYALWASKFKILKRVLDQRHRREDAERLQKEIERRSHARIGVEMLITLLQQAGGNSGGLIRLIRKEGLAQVLEYGRTSPAEIPARILRMDSAEEAAANAPMESPIPAPSGLGTTQGIEKSGSSTTVVDIPGAKQPAIKNWMLLPSFPQAVPDWKKYESLEPQLWQILYTDIWVAPAESWPGNPLQVVLHIPDGRIMFLDSFYEALPSESLREIAAVEEILFEADRRGLPNAPKLLLAFQETFAEQRAKLAEKMRQYRDAHAVDKAAEMQLAEYRKRLVSLKTLYARIVREAPPEILASLSAGGVLADIDGDIKSMEGLLTARPFENRNVRDAMRELVRAVRSLRRAAKEKPPGPSAAPALQEKVPPVVPALPPAVSVHSIKSLMSQKEKSNLALLLHEAQKAAEEYNDRLAATRAAGLPPDTAAAVFDPALLDRFSAEPTPGNALRLGVAFRKSRKEGLNVIRRQLRNVMLRAVEMGYPVDKDGNPDTVYARAILETMPAKKTARNLLREIEKTRDKWPGGKKWLKQWESLQSRPAEEKNMTLLLSPLLVAAAWGLDENGLSQPLKLTLAKIPVPASYRRTAGRLAEFLREQIMFALKHWRWTKEGFGTEEKRWIAKQSVDALAPLEDLMTQSMIPLRDVLSSEDMRNLEKLRSFIREFSGQPYSPELRENLVKFLAFQGNIRNVFRARFQGDVDKHLRKALKEIVAERRAQAKKPVFRKPFSADRVKERESDFEEATLEINEKLERVKKLALPELLAKQKETRPQGDAVEKLAIFFTLWGVEKLEIKKLEGAKQFEYAPLYSRKLQTSSERLLKMLEFLLGIHSIQPDTGPGPGKTDAAIEGDAATDAAA